MPIPEPAPQEDQPDATRPAATHPDATHPDATHPDATGPSLLIPGRTCWRVEATHRFSVIVDAEDYFAHAKMAMRRARRSVYLTAWDFDARIRLTPQRRHPRRPDKLGTLLNWLATTRPDLTIHVLKWDFAELFDLARWSKPLALRNWMSHPRLHYRLDGDHPTGACHHQKMLIVDDAVAFCGGIDITANRWDTRAHRADEPLRRQPDGAPYEPFHDVMMAVDGDAARALGDLFRERWRRATGQTLTPPEPLPSPVAAPRRTPRTPLHGALRRRIDPWPPALVPLLRDTAVGIARTDPACNGRPEVREVEALYLAAIAAARRFIYLESQYFASTAIADALEARLAEPDGPEVVVINPRRTTSWLENTVMLSARAALVKRLRAADRHDRFRLYVALTDGGACITVHAKLMVVDDRLLRIGSANLNNRSMGLDTECDLALEAPAPGSEQRDGDRQARLATIHAIADTRDSLIAEHLGTTPEAVAAELRRRGSLVRAIDALRRPDGRTLEPLEEVEPGALAAAVADARVFDPERPVGAGELMRRVLPSRIPRSHHWLALGLALLVVGGLWVLWHHTGLREWATLDAALDALDRLRALPAGPLWMILLYVAGGLVMFPVLMLIAATALVLGPWWGFPTALGGVTASAATLFWLGRRVGQKPIERYGGAAVRRASERLGEAGVLAMAALRVVPVAPFTVVNLVAGASRIRFSDYLIGTILGMAPGILVFNLLGHQLDRVLSRPTPSDLGLLAAVAVVAVGLGWVGNRVVHRLGLHKTGAAAKKTSNKKESPP